MTLVHTFAAMPWSWGDLPFFILLPFLLVASGFFSGTETALFGLTSHQRIILIRKGGVIGSTVDALLADSRMLLITLMFGNMTINVLYFVISSALLLKLDPKAVNPVFIIVATLAPLIFIILFGEVLPKLLANTARLTWVRFTVLPMFAVHRVIGPLRLFLGHVIITPLARLVAPAERPPALSPDELENLLRLSEDRGVIDRDEERILRAVVGLNQLRVSDIMIPRVDMHAIPVDIGEQDLIDLINETQLTKFPVYEDGLDHVLGILYVKQFLLARKLGRDTSIRKLIRQIRFVPELQRVDDLLSDFRKGGTHIAIAVDEYGGTAGLVTLKDVAECMLGDLDMDEAPGEGGVPAVESLGDRRYRVSGRLAVDDLLEAFGRPEIPERVSTVAGLIMSRLDRLPAVGDTVRLGNLQLTVESMDNRRIDSVELRLLDEPQASNEGGDA